jgi:hypothetical protein
MTNVMTRQEYEAKYGAYPTASQNDEVVSATRGYGYTATHGIDPVFNESQTMQQKENKQAKEGNMFTRLLGLGVNQAKGIAKDIPSDFVQMGQNISSRIGDRTKTTGENILRRKEEGDSLKGAFGTGLDWATDTIRGAAIAVEEAGMFALKTLTTQEQEEAINQAVGAKVQQGVEFAEDTGIADDVRRLVAGYNKVKEENPELVGAGENVAQILGTLAETFGIGKGTTYGVKALDTASDIVAKTTPKIQKGLEAGVKQAGEVVDAGMAARRATQVATQEQKVQTAVGRILQAGDNPRAVEQATRALSDIDTKGIKTYDELNNKLSDRITALSRSVDERLSADTNLYKPAQLSKTTKVGDELITEDPVRNALNGLENAYTQSGEPVNAARIRQLTQKYENEGISLVEANNIAREYGIEFRERAFTKLGEPKQGFNADMYENTRRSVKAAVRDQMPDDLAKKMDAQMSDI